MKKIITLLLGLLFAFSCFACSQCNDDSAVKKGTGEYLLKDGKTEYVIVKPLHARAEENMAVDEFVMLFFEATGVVLPVKTDDEITYTPNGRFISIGDTDLLQSAKVTYDSKIKGINSFAIKTKNKSLFCIGGSEYGINYCIYELLYRMLNFEQFYSDVYTLEEAVTDIELENYDIEEVPNIARCLGTAGHLYSNSKAALRMRAPYNYSNFFAGYQYTLNGKKYNISFDHNTLYYLPPEAYFDEHPKWFMETKQQLCYTAHGDKNERDLMMNAFTEKLKEVIKATPKSHMYVIADMDVYDWCACTECKKSLAKYGTDAGEYVAFYNEVYDKIMEWFANDEEGKQYYDEHFRIILSAYYKTEKAPVIKDENTGTYKPVDERVKLRDGIIVNIAPRFANYTKPFTDEVNKESYETIKGWAAIANSTYLWTYATNFANYMYPLDTFNAFPENAKVFAEANCEILNEQTQNGNMGGMTGWHVLKVYLSNKYSWSTEYDMTTLIDRFFNAMYGAASEPMKEFFYSWREYSLYQLNTLNLGGSFVTRDDLVGTKKYWTKSILDKWERLVEEAIEKIGYLKETNPKKYQILYRNIVMERVFLDYALVDMYKVELGSELVKYQRNLLEGITLADIDSTSEGSKDMNAFLKTLSDAIGGRV